LWIVDCVLTARGIPEPGQQEVPLGRELDLFSLPWQVTAAAVDPQAQDIPA
jgi:hypothetical protein